MLRVKTSLVILAASMTMLGAAFCAPSSTDRTSALIQRLREVDHVQFFLVARTGDYDYTRGDLIDASSIRIFRKCGGNCAQFMEPVLAHLREAKERTCLKGQQDVLITVGDKTDIVYSYSGRHVRIGSRCYFNERGIKEVLRTPRFLF